MQMDVRMLEQEGANGLSLVRGQVVGNDMNLSSLRLAGDNVVEKSDKRGTRVMRHGLAKDFAGLGVERREQRQRAVSVVLEAMALRASRRERQDQIQAIKRLDRRLLVDGKHRGMIRRMDIQSNHIRGLRFEIRIVRLHVAVEAMRLQSGAAPRFRDQVMVNLQ